jgi:hypothetical protein
MVEPVTEGSARRVLSPPALSPSVFTEVTAVVVRIAPTAHDQLGLAALETRQAGISWRRC